MHKEMIIRWAKAHPRLAIGAGAVGLGVGVALIGSATIWLVKGGSGPQPIQPTPRVIDTGPSGRDWLTGVPSDAPAERPFAVMIENHSDARPQSGLSQAAVVFEAPVEGGITRFLAIFPASSSVREIGPVRSARPYYVDWVKEFAADYAHVGGSPEGVERIHSTGVNDADEFAWGRFFWRSSQRAAPHNVYTSLTLLNEMRNERGLGTTSTVSSWRFSDVPAEHPTSSPPLVIDFSSPTYRVEWRYEVETNSYRRYSAGIPANDKDGTPIRAENIVILRTETQVLDEVGRLRLRTTGSGKAWVFKNGLRTDVRWKKPTNQQRLHLETVDGKEMYFTPGHTWVEVTTNDMPVRHGVTL